MSYPTYGRLKWFSPWEPDKSNLGHALEAALVSAVLTPFILKASSFSAQGAFLLASALMLWWYWGREKRDCETGMKLPAGSPKAWLFMWWRPKNILDMAGPILVHAIAWAIYLDLFPSGAL